jgi:TonB family protein
MTIMIADPPRRTSLGVGFDANRSRTSTNPAWKQQIGTRPVPARLALLPEPKTNWNRVGFSAFLQLAALTFFVLVPLLYPEGMKTAVHFYSSTPIAQPITEIPVAPPPPPPAPPKAKIPKVEVKAPDPVEPPKLNPQQPHIFANLAPKVVQPKVEKLPDKAPDIKDTKFDDPTLNIKENGPKRPKDDVKVGNLNTGSAATPTLKPMAPDKVQTGGFGDPNGLPGKGDPNHATNVNRLGSPALPGGEGYGNGTGGKNGTAGVIPSTGFGNGTAIPPTSSKKGTVVAGGFGNATDTSDAPKKKAAPTGPADTAPDITDKPRPEYTAEGRSMRIEGDVRISLVFLANGTVQINKVVSGLGHGLDESAVRAAQQIKFKPAKKDGQPVDFPAVVRIEFRLAY